MSDPNNEIILQFDPEMEPNLQLIKQRFEQIVYQPLTPDTQLDDLRALEIFILKVREAFPKKAEPMVWHGSVVTTVADLKGGMAAISDGRTARDIFKKSIQIDESVVEATAHITLGALYTQIPGWPLGFGSKDDANTHLQKALELYPDDIEANFYYAEYLNKFHSSQDAVPVMENCLRLIQSQNEKSPGHKHREQQALQYLAEWRD